MPDNNPDIYWKVRIPLNLAAILVLVLAAAEWFRTANAPTRASVFTCIFLFSAGLAFFMLAGTVEQWCAPPASVFSALTWSEHPWHEPTLRDCLSVHK